MEVIPSFLKVDDLRNTSTDLNNLNDYGLRTGVVLAAYDTEDVRNSNKNYLEYDVEVALINGTGAITRKIYRQVTVASLFGGVGDYLRWTPRIDPVNDDFKISNGSHVLLLCLNGNTQLAYIIGGIPHNSAPKDGKFEGPELKFEYNGLNVNINQDGDFTLTHKGATKSDGTVMDATNGNAQVSMTKDGLISIGYASSEGDKPKITWDKQADTITIHGNANVKIEANNGPVEITTSSGVKINDATEAFLRGTTYREKQSEFHNTLIQLLEILASQHTAAGAGLSTMAGGPIIGSMSQTFHKMQDAVKEFENYSDQYLSEKHFHED